MLQIRFLSICCYVITTFYFWFSLFYERSVEKEEERFRVKIKRKGEKREERRGD